MPDAPRPFQAVLFDLDNTLYDREAAFGRWADAYLRDTLRLTDPEEATRVRALIFNLDANGYGSKAAIFERLHSLYPTLPGGSARSVDIFFDEFLAHITPEAETEALLDALADARLPFGVITNGSARQWRKIENLGLARRTDCLFVSETFGGKKPGRAIFDAAAVHLGIPPAQILFVGDNPTVDVLGADVRHESRLAAPGPALAGGVGGTAGFRHRVARRVGGHSGIAAEVSFRREQPCGIIFWTQGEELVPSGLL